LLPAAGLWLACLSQGCNFDEQRPAPAEKVGQLQQALGEQAAAITAKWTKLGGAAVLGNATSAVTSAPRGLLGEYQLFTNGVIVSSNDFGAVFLSRVVFDKWLTLQSQVNGTGKNLFDVVGLPIADVVNAGSASYVTFVGGRIVADPSGVRAVYGDIYLRYVHLTARLGLPTSEEQAEGSGDRFQLFQNGQVHFRASLGAFALTGAVLDRWVALGGIASPLGFPTTDTAALADGVSSSGHFEQGAIYSSPSTGTHELTGNLRIEYEQKYGGPNGGLGLPIAKEAVAASGDHFVDFQHGVLVNHTAPFGTPGVYAFANFDLFVDRFDSFGDDCVIGVCGSQDPYWYITVTSESGTVLFDKRWGAGHESDWEVQEPYPLPALTGASAISIKFRGEDIDDGPDDDLGTTTSTYSIDNLWGKFESNDHRAESSDGGVTGTYTIRNRPPFDPADFMGTQWWSFNNPSTDALTYSQYSATFDDVSSDESWTHPFNKIYFEIAYKGVASKGNCYGMSVESLYASVGRSPYAQPIFQYFPDTAQGQDLLPIDGAHASLLNQLNIKQGYQLGFNQVAWTIAAFFAGATHDPVGNFVAGKVLQDLGEATVVSIFDNYVFGKGHTLRVRDYETFGTSCSPAALFCHRIHVADPNYPKEISSGDEFIEIDPTQNYYRYKDYSGGFFTGGRMFITPFRLLSHQQVTPFANPIELLENGLLIISGSTGTLTQATDEQGHTLFEPGHGAAAARWTDLRQDPAQRLATLAPVPLATDGPMPFQLYAGKNVVGTTHDYDFAPADGVTAGTPYELTFESARQSSAFSIPGTPGKPDRITASDIGLATKSVQVAIPSDGNGKAITWTMGGAEKHRWAEFSSLGMAPAQKIKMHTENGGYRVIIENDGPGTNANVRVNAGRGASPVSLGNVSIPSGTTQIDFQLPKTTLSVTGQTLGKNGWLVAPVTIALSAVEYTGKGFDAIEYSTDGVSWTSYTGPFSYSGQGETTLYYRARDKEMNQEIARTQAFRIDTRLPASTGSVSTNAGVKLTYAVTDPVPGSGVFGLHTLVKGSSGPVVGFNANAQGTLTLPTTCSRVEFWAEDIAGNLQSPHTVIADSVKPIFTAVPTLTTTHCKLSAGLVYGVTATDDCGVLTLTSNAPAQLPLGTTNVTWTATDEAGNVATVVQQVTAELGDDPSCCPIGTNIVIGTPSNDTLNGGSGADCLIGLGGQDIIKGFGGADAMSGGEGDDQLSGGDGNDRLYGGTGQDTLRGEANNDVLVCGDGVDWAYGGTGDDALSGGQGTDHLFCEAGNDTALGDADDDRIDGGGGNDTMNGGADHDVYQGGGGVDRCVQDGGDTLSACTAFVP
jgi:Ca2+-binding RTX toxin-like protein